MKLIYRLKNHNLKDFWTLALYCESTLWTFKLQIYSQRKLSQDKQKKQDTGMALMHPVYIVSFKEPQTKSVQRDQENVHNIVKGFRTTTSREVKTYRLTFSVIS